MKITLLKSLMVFGALICFITSQAQTVTGTISDANGPLPGANVVVKGTTNGTQTDFDGNYTLNNVATDATLVVSYIGFKPTEVAVNGQASIDVTLTEDATALDEVVIIGYGSTTIKDATGSVTSVTSEDFNGGVIASPEQLIQGKTAGVNISQASGEPGGGISVNIRGANSVRANNNPLFVVDGVPLFGQNTDAQGDAGSSGGTDVGNPLNFLNPSDIENISILKDASATAIYGSRGANGVVIITTKTGRAGSGGVIEFNSSLSVSVPLREFDLLDRDGFLNAITANGGNAANVDFGGNTDWQDVILRNAASTTNNISYSRNYGSGNIRGSFSYQSQFGVVRRSEFERISGRINWNQRFLDDKLKIGIQTTIAKNNRNQPPLGGQAGFQGDLLGAAYSANPTIPADPNVDPGGGLINPLNLLESNSNETNTNRFLVNGSAEYNFTDEFSAKVTLGFDTSNSENVSVTSANLFNVGGVSGLGTGTFNTLDRENQLLEATVNYKTEFNKSNLDVVVGYAFQDFRTFGFNSAARGFSSTDLETMAGDLVSTVNAAEASISGSFQQFFFAPNRPDVTVNRLFPDPETTNQPFDFSTDVRAVVFDNFDNTDELQSFFARANYSIDNKYLFTGTLRADGSSRFGPENSYGFFPSGAFAWQLAEEDFVGDNISTLKLRLSGGVTGNQDGLGFGQFVARQRFSGLGLGSISNGGTIDNANGLAIIATDQPDLRWEETTDFNVGLDFGFNNDKFNGSLDFYRRDTEDILLQTPPAAPSTNPFQFGNVDANVINQGVELALNYNFIETEDTTFSASFNISYNDNEIENFAGSINLGPINGPGLTGAFAQRFEAGQSLFSYFIATFTGFDADGNPTYLDIDGNGVGDPDVDRSFVGEDALPDVTSGLSLNLSHKNWDFSTFFAGQFGFSVYNNTANALFNAGQLNTARNITVDAANAGENSSASTAVSTRFLEDGDFVRLQNATIGYNVPIKDKTTFKSLRLSLTGQNLFLITDYSGIDPEVTVNTGALNAAALPSRGIDFSAFPNPLTITFGLNARF